MRIPSMLRSERCPSLRPSPVLGLEQPTGDSVSAEPPDQIQVATDDEQVSGPRQSDVEHLPGTALVTEAVDGEHDRRPLQPLKSEHVPVEEVVVLPVRLPVGVLPLRLPL